MARKPRKAGPAPKAVSTLLTAVDFIALAQAEIGSPYETHCRIDGGWITATNGIVAAGHPVQDDISACPHTFSLRAALARSTGEGVSITLTDAGRLSVSSGRFRASINCADPNTLPPAIPDAVQGPVDDRIREALKVVGFLAKDKAQEVLAAAVLLRSGSAVATDKSTIIEAWHANTLPTSFVLPKSFVTALDKVEKKITGLGYTEGNCVTFWFEDGAWLKTQLYNEKYPDTDRIFQVQASPKPMPENFLEAIEAVLPFAELDRIYLKGNAVASHAQDGVGGSYECAGLPNGIAYNGKFIRAIGSLVKTIDLHVTPVHGSGHLLIFYGDTVRGMIMGVTS